MPIIISDLDDTVWRHSVTIVDVMNRIAGTNLTEEEFRAIGHSLLVPQWTAYGLEHDRVIKNQHPDYQIYVNQCWQAAAETLKASNCMGHHISYLTARPPSAFDITLKALKMNNILFGQQTEPVNALYEQLPTHSALYCAYKDGKKVKSSADFKRIVTRQWYDNLTGMGWQGKMIILDDDLGQYGDIIERKDVFALSPKGDTNWFKPTEKGGVKISNRGDWNPNEQWMAIAKIIQSVHSGSVAQSPEPYRLYEVGSELLVVNKWESGYGAFDINRVNHTVVSREEFIDDKNRVLSQIGL